MTDYANLSDPEIREEITRASFSEKLKQMRSELNMTQKEFSDFLEVKQQTLSGYETSKITPSLDVTRTIAITCNVSIDWLCGLSDRRKLNSKIEKYSELIELFLSLDISPENAYPFEVNPEDHIHNIHAIGFDNNVIRSFLEDWSKMRNLYKTKTIDKDVYNLWVEKTMKKYDKLISEKDGKVSEQMDPEWMCPF